MDLTQSSYPRPPESDVFLTLICDGHEPTELHHASAVLRQSKYLEALMFPLSASAVGDKRIRDDGAPASDLAIAPFVCFERLFSGYNARTGAT